MDTQIENKQTEAFYKYRGVIKCLSEGISFITNNFTHIIKLTLPVTLLFSAIAAGLIYLLSDSRLLLFADTYLSTGNNSMLFSYIMILLLAVLLCIVSCFFIGIIYRCIVIHSHNLPLKNFKIMSVYKIAVKYALKYYCYSLLLGIVGMAIGVIITTPVLIPSDGNALLFAKIGITVVLMVAFIVLCLPFNISQPAIYLCKGKFFAAICYGYKKGMKIIGKIFCLSFLVGMLCFVIMMVLAFPSVIMINSYYSATLSQMNGDFVSMPSGFGLWYYLILFVTCYLYTFTIWIQSVPFAYLYASIKSDEKEEKKNSYLMTNYK